MKVRKGDCPFCSGTGYINPPPYYKRKSCNHEVPEEYIRSEIKEKDRSIKSMRDEIDSLSKKVLKLEGLLLKYFG